MLRTLILALLATPAAAADFEFCWEGANGYRLDGTMTVPDAALAQTLVTQTDVTAFDIRGTQNDVPVGTWSLGKVTDTTNWNLNFDPTAMAFVTGGHSASAQGQEWNTNGRTTSCNQGGFGFNAGSGGQDLCLDGTYIPASAINESTPFPVFPAGEGGICSGMPLLGGLPDLTPPTQM